ncbi:MAG TPA: glycosyltransferase family 9 protein [Thermoanaerobaculia bacterium]|nr:glycosyltransferase family 9 protein [Thermoanaerobaculia bacterium]
MIGASAVAASPVVNREVARRFHNPVVLFANGRGDYLMHLPIMRALTALFEGRLTLVTRPSVQDLFYHDLSFARVIEIDCEPGPDGPEFDFDRLSATLAGCDLFLSLNPWCSRSLELLLASLSHIPTIGFWPQCSLRLPLDFSKHTVDLGFDVARCFSSMLAVEAFAGVPRFAERHERLARDLRASLPAGARVAAVHGDTKIEKMWSADRFAELIRWLLGRDPHLYVFDVGLHRADGGRLADHPRVISCSELVLPAAFALIGQLDFFIGVDSCFLHAADLYRVPGVGLFGATAAHEFGFRFGPHRHVTAASMSAIQLSDVIAAIESLLGMEVTLW